MIAPVAPVGVPPLAPAPQPPAVVPVAPAAEVSTRLEQGPERDRRGAPAPPAATPVDSPPEPLSTQSVLLLRQSGASLAGIAEAYGISIASVRRLMHADSDEGGRPQRVAGADA